MAASFLDRIAGAPITWGVDGAPGWGYLMDRDRVMREMSDVGLTATELGPDGYLPADTDELTDFLSVYDFAIVGGFVPALLYRLDRIDDEPIDTPFDCMREVGVRLDGVAVEDFVCRHAKTQQRVEFCPGCDFKSDPLVVQCREDPRRGIHFDRVVREYPGHCGAKAARLFTHQARVENQEGGRVSLRELRFDMTEIKRRVFHAEPAWVRQFFPSGIAQPLCILESTGDPWMQRERNFRQARFE